MRGIGTIDWPAYERLTRLATSSVETPEPAMTPFLQTAAEILIETLAALGEAG